MQRGKSRNATMQQVEDVSKVWQRAKTGYFEEFSGAHQIIDGCVDGSPAPYTVKGEAGQGLGAQGCSCWPASARKEHDASAR
jgi:hypothetical protein